MNLAEWAMPIAQMAALYVLLGVLNLLLGRKSQIDAWVETHPRVAAALKLLRSLGFDPWLLRDAASLAVQKRLPVRADVEIPRPPKVPTLPLVMFLLLFATACSSSTPTPSAECLSTYSRCRVSIDDACPKVWNAQLGTWSAVPDCRVLMSCKAEVLEACS